MLTSYHLSHVNKTRTNINANIYPIESHSHPLKSEDWLVNSECLVAVKLTY